MAIKLHWTRKREMKRLYSEGFTTDELYLYYKGIVPTEQLRAVVRGVKRRERI